MKVYKYIATGTIIMGEPLGRHRLTGVCLYSDHFPLGFRSTIWGGDYLKKFRNADCPNLLEENL